MKFLVSEKLSPHKYKTAEGYLVCVDAVLARTGKQSYMRDEIFGDGDETIVEVDRTPEEVFSEATLASFENKPITVEHPSEDVNSENFKEYSVGFVRDVHRGVVDGQDVILGTLVIQDAQTIEEIENGEHTDLSCGYDCDIQDEDNLQQRNIRGNHVALCAEGRAGNARIMDSVKDQSKSFNIFVMTKYGKSYLNTIKAESKEAAIAFWKKWHDEYANKDIVAEITDSRKNLLDMSQKCVICGETFDGYGNNAEPVKKGICCDVCNVKYVIPARINKMHDSKKVKDKLSSSYRIIETLPNGYGIAQTYGDGLFYIFKDDEVLYGSYAFLENAKEALNKYKNVKDSKEELRRTTGNLIREEVNATEDYDNALMEKDLTPRQRKTFEEIRNDEIDHEEKLTNIYKDLKEGSVEEDIKDSVEDSYYIIACEGGDFWFDENGKPNSLEKAKRYKTYEEADRWRKSKGQGSVQKIEDAKCKDTNIHPDDLRRFCIKHDYYTYGSISEYNNLLYQISNKGSLEEIAMDIAVHSKPNISAKEVYQELKKEFSYAANDSKTRDSKLYSITWKNGNKVMKSTLVSDSMTSAIAKFQKYIRIRGIKDAMVDIEGIKKSVNRVRKAKKLKGDK